MDYSKEKIVAIIPAYEPPHSFIEYAKELLKEIPNLIVVNDGSNEKYNDIFDTLSSLNGCVVLRHEENHGKGYALKTAFKYAKENFDESFIFVTKDWDGQHLLKDLINVSKSAFLNPNALHLGSRDFSSPNVPKRSKGGNIQTRRLFNFLYGIKLSDTQTGLRAFSYNLLDTLLGIKGDRFEYEMNMLIKMKKKGISIEETPIATIYEPKPEDVEKVSHYRTFKDSFRVLGVLLSNLGWYFISSALSSILDVVAFYLFSKFVFAGENVALHSFFATVSARVLSSILNFTINFKYVFNGKSKSSIFKYYFLWSIQLGLSYLFAFLWNNVFTSVALVTVCKGAMDLIVAMLSYFIQSRWVFAPKKPNKFYGGLLKFTRGVANFFAPKKRYKNSPKEYGEPVVYVCRHLNMHGPFTVVRSFKKDLHFFVLHTFFTKKDAYEQFLITFKNKKNKKFLAKVSSSFVPKLLKSAEFIPVFRGKDYRALSTIKTATNYLLKGESLAVFPDIDYWAKMDTPSNIYSGFLLLEKKYYKATKNHLKFVPLVIDDKNRTIIEKEPISFTGEIPFKEEMAKIKNELIAKINNMDKTQK